jgi:hypothetical protein
MSSKDKPAHKVAQEFCRAYLGRDCFAPFTGQDGSGWNAFVYLVEMWGRADYTGREAVIVAMRAVLSGVQNKECIHQVFCQTIPALLDWCHVAEIWPQLIVGAPGRVYCGTNWNLTAVKTVTEAHRQREQREDRRAKGPRA